MKTYKVTVAKDGLTRWFNEFGHAHRENGPAIEYPNGTKYWCIDGEIHREDGPAVIDVKNGNFWYIRGKSYSESEFKKKMSLDGQTRVIDGKTYKLVLEA